MKTSAKILADTRCSGHRLTTFECVYPRFILAEVNTHRALSRNSASSRAVPASKVIETVEQNPFIPSYWGAAQKGMQADFPILDSLHEVAEKEWLAGRNAAVMVAKNLLALKLHKQLVNRVLEPYLWVTSVISATEWKNFFRLRNHHEAQPEFRELAAAMQYEYESKIPFEVDSGYWHLPYVTREERRDIDINDLKGISAARCARVSYFIPGTQSRTDRGADLDLCEKLRKSGHMSPFEHQAAALGNSERHGNFVGFLQYRKQLTNESNGDYAS